MSAWDQEIELILKGELNRAAEVYHQHRPDVGIKDCLEIVKDVAKIMGVAVAKLERKEKVRV